MNKPKIIIGIDPDTSKSGVCILNMNTMQIELVSATFSELAYDILLKRKTEDVQLIVENSWSTKHNWHSKTKDSRFKANAMGVDVGRCHEVGRKIIECAEHLGLSVIGQHPLKKIWKGLKGKITHDEIKSVLNNLKIECPNRTNQEERDATLLALDYAGLPLRVGDFKLKK